MKMTEAQFRTGLAMAERYFDWDVAVPVPVEQGEAMKVYLYERTDHGDGTESAEVWYVTIHHAQLPPSEVVTFRFPHQVAAEEDPA